KTDIVFRQHDMPNALPVFRLVLADPQKLRECEIGQSGIAGQLDQAVLADFGGKVMALFFGADVAPDQRGTDDTALLVEQDGAMHLAGKTDASDFLGGKIRA